MAYFISDLWVMDAYVNNLTSCWTHLQCPAQGVIYNVIVWYLGATDDTVFLKLFYRRFLKSTSIVKGRGIHFQTKNLIIPKRKQLRPLRPLCVVVRRLQRQGYANVDISLTKHARGSAHGYLLYRDSDRVIYRGSRAFSVSSPWCRHRARLFIILVPWSNKSW